MRITAGCSASDQDDEPPAQISAGGLHNRTSGSAYIPMQQITVKLTDAIRATPHTTSLGSFTIKKSLIFGSTAVALQRYPYPSKSIIHIAYCKLLEFLNVRIFIFDGNRKALAPAFYTINRSIRHTYIWELLSTLPIPIGAAIKHLNDLTALFAAGLEYDFVVFRAQEHF